MNDLHEAYSCYSGADNLLKLLSTQKRNSISRASIKKIHYWNTVVELLLAYEFISLSEDEKNQRLVLTEKGRAHLEEGGFQNSVYVEPKGEENKTFIQHLDDITGLLTIFGILNAVTIFASQIKTPEGLLHRSLNISGADLISVSMYLLSLLVLWEIVWITLKEGNLSFKFKTLYILLCTTTLGIGLAFLTQYEEVLYAAAIPTRLFWTHCCMYGRIYEVTGFYCYS